MDTKNILETKRLFLRELNPKDAESLYRLNRDAKVLKYTGDPRFVSVTDAQRFLENYDHYKRSGLDTLQLSVLIGRAMKENTASIRVLEKIGLTYHRDFDVEGNDGVIYRTT